MKIREVLPEHQLDESAWRKALAVGALSAASLAPQTNISPGEPTHQERPADEIVSYGRQSDLPDTDFEPDIPHPKDQLRQSELTNKLARHYRVNKELVSNVVSLAFRYEDSVFPKAEDILAVIGVESSFDPESVSNLRNDPAKGLMQVRPGVWNIDPDDLDNVENQIKYGAGILNRYYKRLKNPEAALQAYNLGITRYRRGDRNERYVNKVSRVRDVVGGI